MILEATDWWKQWSKNDGAASATRPVLVAGDGRTLARRGEFDLTAYGVVATGPEAAHALSADVYFLPDPAGAGASVQRDAGAHKARFVLTPRTSYGGTSLRELTKTIPQLAEWEAQNKLVACDLPDDPPPAQVIANTVTVGPIGFYKLPAELLSRADPAAQVVAVLAKLGAKTMRTLGVDYGPEPTREAVAQGDIIASLIQRYSLDFGPLTAETPARIFIGADPSQMLGARILEYSIRKHATLTTQFDAMQSVKSPQPKDPRNQPRTEFSFSRFAIPSLAGYKGRALYLDADMLVFSDLRELWELPFGTATAMYAPPSDPKRPPQTSVMLMDCDRLTWDLTKIVADLDAGRYDYEGLMRDMKLEPEGAVQDRLPTVWNSLEEYAPNKTRLLHYTDMKFQPWVSRKNPHIGLWTETLRQALADNFVTLADIRQAARNGFIRPSLYGQMRLPASAWPAYLKTLGPVVDARYKPHRNLRKRLSKAGM